MGGKSETTQQSSQQSQLTPWAPAGAALGGILSGLQPSIDNMSGTPQTNAAFDQLYANGSNPNPLGAAALGAAGSMLNGGANYDAATSMLNNSYANTARSLSPYTSGNAMDPTSNPALAQALQTNSTDVMNSVNPMFAAAGRLASPDNFQALGRGITQGSTGILQNAQTNQLNAINALQSAAGGTASGLSGADAARAGIQGGGIGNAANAYGVQNLGPQTMLNAALGKEQLPQQNAAALAGILGPLAQMFGQQNQSGSATGTSTMSGAQQAWGWMNALANLGKAFGGGGIGGGLGGISGFGGGGGGMASGGEAP
jgi:hypothetical protein